MTASHGWVELTPWEIAFLAAVPDGRRTLLDELSTAGDWLRSPEYQRIGEGILAHRLAEQPADRMSTVFREYVALAARVLGSAEEGGLLSTPDLVLLNAWSKDVMAQLVVSPTGSAIRVLGLPLELADLEAELLGAIAPTGEVRAGRRVEQSTSFRAWPPGASSVAEGTAFALALIDQR